MRDGGARHGGRGATYSGAMPLPPLVEPGPELSPEEAERYSRHLLLGPVGAEGQRRLLAARVLVLGAGGLGAPALLYLAAAGVGTLGIVDDDDVEASNLQRQVIHGERSVGRPKVDSAADRIADLNPDVAVERHHLRLDATNARDVLGAYDVVLDGTDNFPTRYLVSDVCAELGIPVVWGSILRFDAQVAVFWSRPPAPAPAVTLRDLFPAPPPPGTTPSCGEAGVLGAMCGQVGALMATEAVKLITGAGEPLLGRVAVLDALAARWQELPLRPMPGRRPPRDVAELGYDPTPAACQVGPDGGRAPSEVTVQELAERLAARERGADDFVLVDVREAAERSIAVIPGAVHAPLAAVLADPAGALAAVGAGPDDAVLVHCRSGARSAQARAALLAAGYRDVRNVAGGVRAWSEQVDPTVPRY